jgi:hypothetical protein
VLPWFKHGNTRSEIQCLEHILDIIYGEYRFLTHLTQAVTRILFFGGDH